MSDFQFWPTPPSLARRVWAMFKNRDFVRVLEPSAGDGALADAHPWENDRYFRGANKVIDCCEIDVTKHAVLRSKGYQVIGLDFLQMGSASHISHIVLNPPFLRGAAHVLKAFDLLWDGEIAAIINSETLTNPYTRERQRLVRLIEEFGYYEIVEGAFMVPEAEKKTAVTVALVYLKKSADVKKDIVGDLIADLKVDSELGEGFAAGVYAPENTVALPNSFIENSVVTFNAAVAAMRDSVRYEARARHYAALLGDTMAVHCGSKGSSKEDYTTKWVKSELGQRYDQLKDRSWTNLLRSADISSKLSSAAQKRLEREFDEIKKLSYTVLNIRGFLCGLIDSQSQISEEMICDCFDLISKWHTENRVYGYGWKSNSKHRTLSMQVKKTRFILPGHGTERWHSGLPWDSLKLLSDFDKCFALLAGERSPEVSLVNIFENNFKALCDGERIYGSYFSVRYWPSAGTIHFFPVQPQLIDRLNRVVGKKRAWLPPSDCMASEEFWNAYNSAEKFDKEVRKEVSKHRRSRWESPLDSLHDVERRESAENLVLDAVEVVLERHGICVDQLLASPHSSPQLELQAA